MTEISTQTILVGAGIVFIFLAIVGRLILPRIGIRPKLTKWTRISLGIVGIIFLTIGILYPVLQESVVASSDTATPSSTLSPMSTSKKFVRVPDAFYPSGWMGDWGDITLEDASTDDPRSEPTCIKIIYSASRSQGEGWVGVYWQYPDKNWGDKPEGRDLTGTTKLTFWARGEKGGEKAEFKVGGITGKYPDSIQPPVSTGIIVLSNKWQQYTIDLTGEDLSHVIGGFCWVTNKNQNPNGCTIYVDDISYGS